MVMFIAAIFIGWHFYKSATNIEKNGLLWVGIALATFISTSFIAGLLIRYFMESVYEVGQENGLLLGIYLGMIFGVISLGFVNHFMNQIPD